MCLVAVVPHFLLSGEIETRARLLSLSLLHFQHEVVLGDIVLCHIDCLVGLRQCRYLQIKLAF